MNWVVFQVILVAGCKKEHKIQVIHTTDNSFKHQTAAALSMCIILCHRLRVKCIALLWSDFNQQIANVSCFVDKCNTRRLAEQRQACLCHSLVPPPSHQTCTIIHFSFHCVGQTPGLLLVPEGNERRRTTHFRKMRRPRSF